MEINPYDFDAGPRTICQPGTKRKGPDAADDVRPLEL